MGGAESLVMDFSKLDYISSAGLRVLLSAHKAMSTKGGMKVKNVNEIVQEVLDVTGFSDTLPVQVAVAGGPKEGIPFVLACSITDDRRGQVKIGILSLCRR